jgi:endonuclease YncB( thermonuclease family)
MNLGWRTRRRLWRIGITGVVAAVLVSAGLDYAGAFHYAGDDWSRFDRKSFEIVRTVHCDLIEIRTDHGIEQVQLAGLYGPKLPNDHFSQAALDYASRRVSGKQAVLRLEPLQPRDASGHLVAHVYLLDTDNLNADMIKDGIAYADRRSPNSMRGHYEQLENEARKRKYGLWKAVTVARMPEWRQKWIKQRTRTETN